MKKVTVLKIFIFVFFVLVGYGSTAYVKYILLLNRVSCLSEASLWLIGAFLCLIITIIPYLIGTEKLDKHYIVIFLIIIAISLLFGLRNIDNNKIVLLCDKDISKTAITSLHIVIPLVAFICGVLEERENKI